MSTENWLLSNRLRAALARVEGAVDPAQAATAWAEAERDVSAAQADEDEEIALPVLERSPEALGALVRGWDAGTSPLPEWDTAVLKRALKAYRKRLKLARLDDETTTSRNPLSRGEESGILGVRPPDQYPPEVWALLVAQGKLSDAGGGLLELTTS